jgi:hypothetical protein
MGIVGPCIGHKDPDRASRPLATVPFINNGNIKIGFESFEDRVVKYEHSEQDIIPPCGAETSQEILHTRLLS